MSRRTVQNVDMHVVVLDVSQQAAVQCPEGGDAISG